MNLQKYSNLKEKENLGISTASPNFIESLKAIEKDLYNFSEGDLGKLSYPIPILR